LVGDCYEEKIAVPYRVKLAVNSLAAVSVMLYFADSATAYSGGRISNNEFNPAISLTLEGRYADYDEPFELPGFQVAGEAGIYDKGFTTGHNELTFSANIDNYLYGMFNTAIVREKGETLVEMEEAYIQTLGLGNGFTIKGGQFYSGIGYLNSVHDHAHDFADVPLVYAAMFGNHLLDTGAQLRWLAPTDLFIELGAEVTSGREFPGGDNQDNNNGAALFVKTGGDISVSSSWLAGVSYYSTEFDVREGGGHAHGGEPADVDLELLNGETSVAGIDFVYKWSPNGNPRQRNFKFQFEYFMRDEDGRLEYADPVDSGAADYDGEQSGYYMQAVYQWMPRWRVGLRYDHLESDNTLSNAAAGGLSAAQLGEETELVSDHDPERATLMVDYSSSEYSRFRVQYMKDDAGEVSDNRIYFQYLMSLGSHGAHNF
jgi:hypothetical protein